MKHPMLCLVATTALGLFCGGVSVGQWHQQTIGTPGAGGFFGVHFVNANTGTAVGGTIFRTTDGGGHWVNQGGDTLGGRNVFFAGADKGWIVGGESSEGGGSNGWILRTTDGGTTWLSESFPGWHLSGVCFADAENGIAVGKGGIILKTTDGGILWNLQVSGTDHFLYDVAFSDDHNGWVVGYDIANPMHGGAILRTTDGGTTWNTQIGSTTDGLFGVSFTDSVHGTVVGANGTILRTTNGGTTWTAQTSGTLSWLSDVSFVDVNNGWVVGGEILRTTNGGTDWVVQLSATNLYNVCFTDANNGTAVGIPNTVLRTTNGGVTFVEGDRSDNIPTAFSLLQNYPNPFNPSTTIKYELPHTSHVSLSVFDVLGREVSVLVNERRDAGVHEVRFDRSHLASGVYLYRLQAGDFKQTKRLVLLK